MLSHFALRFVVVPESTKFCSSTDEGIRGNKSELAGGASTIVMSTSVCPPSLVNLFSSAQSDNMAKIQIYFSTGSTVILLWTQFKMTLLKVSLRTSNLVDLV